MNLMRYLTAVMARFFLSIIFLASGAHKMIHWQATEKELMKVLSDWQTTFSFSSVAQTIFSNMMVWAPLLLMGATLLELLGALLLFLGVKEKLGAFLLILFLLPVTFLFHQFWFVEGEAYELQLSLFLRNMAILGGLMMVLVQKKDEQGDSFSLERIG
jgi:putative oxidoreductase